MRNCIVGLVLLGLLCAAPVWAKDLKIGVVDIQTVMEESVPGEAALKELKSSFDEMKAELDKHKEDVMKLRQEIQKQSLVLSQEAQIDKETEYKQKVREFQGLQQSYQKKMGIKEKKLTEPILDELKKVIDAYGKKYEYTLILDKKNSGAVYHDASVDITKNVIEELNKAWSKN